MSATAQPPSLCTWNVMRLVRACGDNMDGQQLVKVMSKLLPVQPDLLAVQETHFYCYSKKSGNGLEVRHALAAGLLPGYRFYHSECGRTECGFYVRDGSPFACGTLWPRAKLPWDRFGKFAVYECRHGVVVNVHLPTPTIKQVVDGWKGAPPAPDVSDDFRGWELRGQLDGELYELVRSLGTRLLAVLGDFNVTHTANDAAQPMSGRRYADATTRFDRLIRDNALIDVWRQQHPDTRQYTSFQNRGGSRFTPPDGRVDYCLMPKRWAAKVQSANIMEKEEMNGNEKSILSDHVPVVVSMMTSASELDGGHNGGGSDLGGRVFC